jgi:Leucine-rich repeat (LRR) protein
MLHFLSLPVSIFGLVSEYFVSITISLTKEQEFQNLENWRYFCNCSQKLKEVKRYFAFYNLNKVYSCGYITFYDDIHGFEYESITRLLNIVANPRTQIILRCPDLLPNKVLPHYLDQLSTVYGLHCYTNNLILLESLLQVAHNLCFLDCSGVDFANVELSRFDSSKILRVGRYGYLTDFSVLRNVFELDLSYTSIQDISYLRNVKKLVLAFCYELLDVSPLSKVWYLDLSSCPTITDVSMLGNVHTLILTNCRGITDISALGNVQVLSCSGLDIVKTFSRDNNVKDFTCPSSLIEEVGNFLSKDRKRYLTVQGFCKDFYPFLKGFRRLHIRHNTILSGVRDFNDLISLKLSWCHSSARISNLPLLTSLSIEESRIYIDYHTLPKLSNLILKSCHIPELKSPLQHVTVRNCSHISVDVYTHLQSLRLFSCSDVIVCRNRNILDYFYPGKMNDSCVLFGEF